ncbi:hypothetical protein BIV03_04950 [Curtobacterium sp. MCBA15_016]|nr:hypothetical protein BIV03_04950 [Curtobacterium sp. MCBA15_016]
MYGSIRCSYVPQAPLSRCWKSPRLSGPAASPWSRFTRLDSPIAVITPTAWVCGPMPMACAALMTYAALTRRS